MGEHEYEGFHRTAFFKLSVYLKKKKNRKQNFSGLLRAL